MQDLFESIAICSDIPTTVLSELLKAFSTNHLDGIVVSDLDNKRLKLLLENGKFPFTDENTKVLNETDKGWIVTDCSKRTNGLPYSVSSKNGLFVGLEK